MIPIFACTTISHAMEKKDNNSNLGFLFTGAKDLLPPHVPDHHIFIRERTGNSKILFLVIIQNNTFL